MTEFNPKAVPNTWTKPYPIRMYEGFFDINTYSKLKAEMPALNEFESQVRMHGDLSEGDRGYTRLLESSSTWRNLHNWVFSDKFSSTMLDLFADDIEVLLKSGDLIADPRLIRFDPLFREGRSGELDEVPLEHSCLFSRMDVGYGLDGYGRVNGGRGIHIDNWPRLVSGLIYFSDASDFEGGQFVVHSFKKGIFKSSLKEEMEFECRQNRAIFSIQSNIAFHSVKEVKNVVKPRYAAYVALSCNSGIWNKITNKKQADLSQSRRSRFAK